MAETVPFGPPQELGAVADHAPRRLVGHELVEFEVGGTGFFQQLGRGAGGGVDAEEPVGLEVAGAVGVEELAAVGGPLHGGVGGVAARVVARVGIDIRAHPGAALHVEDPQLRGGDDRVARERVGPRVQDGAVVGGLEEVEAPHLAFVVAVRGDAARIGRPLQHGRPLATLAAHGDLRAAAFGDRAVAVVLLAVVAELDLLAALGVAHPKILVTGEGDPAAVGGGTIRNGGCGVGGGAGAGVGGDIAAPMRPCRPGGTGWSGRRRRTRRL